MDWYAIFVKTGREDETSKILDALYRKYCVNEKYILFVPKRKLIEYSHGNKTIVLKTLFPGYILIKADNISKLYETVRDKKCVSIIKFLKTNCDFHKINPVESKIVLSLLNREGIINTSYVNIDKTHINILDGPLCNYTGIIKKINRRKERAKIQISFLDRECFVDISIKCIDKIENQAIKKKIYFKPD
jgi:transcriptional antiterminator NusG